MGTAGCTFSSLSLAQILDSGMSRELLSMWAQGEKIGTEGGGGGGRRKMMSRALLSLRARGGEARGGAGDGGGGGWTSAGCANRETSGESRRKRAGSREAIYCILA